MLRPVLIIVTLVIILIPLLLLLGLRIQPRSFPSYPESTPDLATMPLPKDLPAPVERFYRTIMGARVPVVDSAVINTRGKLRINSITFPTRFVFTHDAGQGYRHYIEVMFFGFPLMKINERYLDGRARMELPFGVVENEPKIDMAANLGLWGESIWLPSIFITDPRVRWEAVDNSTARLIVPFKESEDEFIVFFNAETGLIERLETMRYREADNPEKLLWILEPRGWSEFNSVLIPSPAAVTWADEGTPWLVVNLEEVVYNADVGDYIRSEGP
jgi:hypothetical protein